MQIKKGEAKMKITERELEMIASTPEQECFMCDDILYQIEINEEGERYTRNLF